MLVPLLLALGMTLLIEGIVVLGFDPQKKWFGASVVCNIITNPLVNIILSQLYGHRGYALVFLLLEAGVVIAEAFLYNRLFRHSLGICFVASLIANAVSCIGGIIIF